MKEHKHNKEIKFRLAKEKDLKALALMCWEWEIEEGVEPKYSKGIFLEACTASLREGFFSQNWVYWIAEEEECIVSHIFCCIVHKVPSLHKLVDGWGYVTNVYTKPSYRGRKIGAELMEKVKNWAHKKHLELLITSSNEVSEHFFMRSGFSKSHNIQVLQLREH